MKKKTIGALALGMFAWGAFKAFSVGRQAHDGCPLCARDAVIEPKHLISSLVTGPLIEEMQFRQQLPKLIGSDRSSMAFGALHASTKLSAKGNAARVLEAGLAGALVYSKAFERGGLGAATVVHAAHNLGADLGMYLFMGDRAKREGWRRQRKQVVPGVHSITCACSAPGVKPCLGSR